MNYYLEAFKQYAVFDGRASRPAYWMFYVFNVLAGIVVAIIGGIIHATWLSSLYSLAVLLPSWAVSVRRLHDTGRSGWHLLWSLLPFIGWIILIVFFAEKSHGENQYGVKPPEAL